MTDTRHRTSLGSTFRFAVRLLGLLGASTAALGGVLAAVLAPQVLSADFWKSPVDSLTPLVSGDAGTATQVGVCLALAGVGLVLVWLLVELAGGLFLVTGRKSAEGTLTFVLAALAVAVLVVVNWVSVEFYGRGDFTRDKRFTLDRALVDDLKKLDPNTPTTVLVLQLDKTSAFDPDQPDAVTSYAQQKITEKVLDLIDELRQHPELSARFDVHVLSRKDEKFEERLGVITGDKPELRAAVEAAPESSIFFASNRRVRRMPFGQFYMLDKTASRGKEAVGGEANPAAANLVLAPQGKERFVRALVGLERRQPKIGLLTIHPYLTSRKPEDEGTAAFSSFGLRSALERDGCEVIDVVLKKGWDGGTGLSPSAGTFDESKLEEIEAEYLGASESALESVIERRNLEIVRERVQNAPIAQVEANFRAVAPRGQRTEPEYRQFLLTRVIDPSVAQLKTDEEEANKRVAALEPEYRKLLGDDRVQADRRAADVYAKLKASVADCDLLIIPRYTTMSLVNGQVISPTLYPLAKSQTDVVREFLTAGKPVLFAFGPATGSRGPGATSDDNELLLQRLGFELGTQTVLTSAEAAAMKKPSTLGDRSVQLPTLEVVRNDNPVATAFDRANRTVDGTLELKRSGYRPIYLAPRAKPFANSPVVLQTTEDAWNEDRPVPESAGRPGSRPYFPKFDTLKPDDPKKGTREEEKKQKFVVGVAAEVPVPAEWTNPNAAVMQATVAMGATGDLGFGPGVAAAVLTPDAFQPKATDKTVRVAVFGHGGFFVGRKLDPGQEALLVSTVNWQLGRDDSLPKDVPDADKWRYPRVPLDDKQQAFWQIGGLAGLPFVAFLLGVVALLFRWRR